MTLLLRIWQRDDGICNVELYRDGIEVMSGTSPSYREAVDQAVAWMQAERERT